MPRRFSSSGYTRLELFVFIVVAVVLFAVAYGPVVDYLTNGKVTRAVESARTISTLLSQYSTDNNGVYPTGEGTTAAGKSEGIALNLLQNNFLPDASAFAVGSTPKYRGTAADFSDLAASNLSWDFTGGATASTGITSAASDLLPTVYGTSETVAYPTTPGTGLDVTLSGNGPFGTEGIVVAYKANNAVFIKGTPSGAQRAGRGLYLQGGQGHGDVHADQAVTPTASAGTPRPRRGRRDCR